MSAVETMSDEPPGLRSDEPPGLRSAIAGRELNAGQRSQLAAVLRTLERDEHAPTAIRDPRQAADAHVADSLVALDVEALRDARSIADVGAGAGFPGAALAIALPRARVSLLESQQRKCDFLVRLCAAAEIANATVLCTRAEEWQAGIAGNDVVLARAVAAQPVVLEYAAPLLRLGGVLVDWRGRRSVEQERASASAAEILGLRLVEIRRVEPFAGATDLHLHVFVKVHVTPERYPRRAGMARKRPLGA
jgi:16S rRNA (guanine527-N7)-methyltransferase